MGNPLRYCPGARQKNGVDSVQVSSVNSARPQRPALYLSPSSELRVQEVEHFRGKGGKDETAK